MNKILWEEWGNKPQNKGSIVRVRVPFIWWVVDRWFEKVHDLWSGIPGWRTFWSKVIPDWGDPLCAAYCFKWSSFYWGTRVEEFTVEVGYDNLSDDFKKDYEKDFD